MTRLLLALLLCGAAVDLSASPVRPGVFNGFWRTRFRTNEFYAVGPLTVVVPTNGRPSVYFWSPVETTNGVEYLADTGRAMFPGRRGVLGTVRGFGHFKGRRDTSEGWTATLAGQLRHDGHRGLFSVTRYGTPFYDPPLIPEQWRILQEQGLVTTVTQFVLIDVLTNRAPTPDVPTNIFPPTPRPGPVFTNVIGPAIRLTNAFNPGVVVRELPPPVLVTNVWVMPWPTNNDGLLIRAFTPSNYLYGDGRIWYLTNSPPGYYGGGAVIIPLPPFIP